MDPKRFDAPSLGKPVKTPGAHGYWTYHPQPLPTALALKASTVRILSEADRALGRLAGAGRLLPNPHLLLQPYVAREALASSRIEGTQASLSEVFDAQARETAEGPVREVTNYIRALEHGLARLADLPVSKRLLREVHAILLEDVRGQERMPGEFRRSQNWIGSADNRPDTARFVPPPPAEMEVALDALERYFHAPTELPPLIEIALIHYQFETIHPFLDGNGRLGRLLIAFLLVQRSLLPQPLLYLSAYFERRRSDYYDRLQAVRERGELAEWLDFFLTGVSEESADAVSRAEALADLREQYRSMLAGDRSRAGEVVDLVFQNPFLVTNRVAAQLDVTAQSAMNHIRRLESEGIVQEVVGIPGRSKRWVATEVFRVLDPDATLEFNPQES
ncbi:Fic family protein [Candidatus Poriferisocius sp.]|uniref:Fic family protein n=1 Tax=Candidatus Poriferisocius sp. TaxID=3101276 RepID=UPI003B5C0E42